MKRDSVLIGILSLNFMLACTPLGAQNNIDHRATSNFAQYLNKTMVNNITSKTSEKILNEFNNIDNTTGKRFLFDSWVSGDSVLDMQGNLLNTTGFIFNFDMITGNLLATQDKINNMAVLPEGVRSFILKNNGKQYQFEHVKAIDSSKFFLALVRNDIKYALYKLFKAKFIPSNYRNEGLIQTGNPNDQYKDESEYYIIDNKSGKAEQLSLKSKSIRAAFETSEQKVKDYFRDHGDDSIDENFLTGLVKYVNL